MHRLLGILLLGLVTACSAESPSTNGAANSATASFEAGTDYQVIDPPVPVPADGKVHVTEVFGYNCPHCAHAQPVISAWKARLPADVEFQYMPAVFGGVWEVYARVFYTAQTMGVLDKIHEDLFRAIHEEHQINNLDDIGTFFANHGVPKEQFMATMNSFPVEAKLSEGREKVQALGVEGTPTMIVDGKYRVSVPRAEHGFEKMLEIVDFLINKERAERG